MPATERKVLLRVGNRTYKATPISAADAAIANARIQKKLQPVIIQARKTRRAAVIAASKIVLNA